MSDFNVISPIDILDAILFGSNVPENDLQEFSPGTAYAVGDTVMVATSVANVHKTYECLVAQNAGLTADILDENCSDISDWTDGDTGTAVSEVSPAGQFRFAIDAAGGLPKRHRTLAAPPNTFSLEIKTYFDVLGVHSTNQDALLSYSSATWKFRLLFGSDGLFVSKAAGVNVEVGTDIVKSNATAAWQTWRFQVNKTTESTATVEVFLKEEGGAWVSQGTADCDYEIASTNGQLIFQLRNNFNNDVSHIDYVKIATGLGQITDTSDTPVGNSNWLETGSTNRWKAFNGVLGSQTEQATKIEYVLTPGAVIDSVALLNIESDTVDIVEIDTADDLITNGQAWTDATGATPPTGWTVESTNPTFTIESGCLKMEAGVGEGGCNQTNTVIPGTEMQFLLKYRNAAGDLARYRIYDVTHSASITSTTDLPNSETDSIFSSVFTVPADCTQILVAILCKSAGDIVYFDFVRLSPTEYSESVTTGASKTSVIKTDIPQKAAGILTVTINKSGTAAIGELKIGTKTSLGTMRPKPQIGFRNLSTLDEDTFGNIDIVSRGYKQKLICGITVTNTNLDTVYKFLCDHKDDMMVYVGSESYSCLQLYGFSKEPQIVVGQNISDMSLEIWSVI